MTHDIFPFVNVFVVTNILTRNYHEFLHFLILSQYIIQSMLYKKISNQFINDLSVLIKVIITDKNAINKLDLQKILLFSFKFYSV